MAVPTQVLQQGRLLGGDGLPFEGAHALVFTLHDADSDGNMVWEEMQAVAFEQGYYAAVLGKVVPLDDLLFASGTVWLQLEADGEVLSPRQEVVSVPHALRAAIAAVKAGATQGKQDWACQTLDVDQSSISVWVTWDDGNTAAFPTCRSPGNNSYEADNGTWTVLSNLPARNWHPADCGDPSELCEHDVETAWFK